MNVFSVATYANSIVIFQLYNTLLWDVSMLVP